MIKDHMHNPYIPKRTRCGQPIGNLPGPRIIAWEYGSPKTTCKTCLRLHALDVAKGNCSKCRFSDLDNDHVCLMDHSQIYTTYNGQTVRIGYFAHGRSCPDFKLIGGDDQ